ncbi:unnamed protein product [Merluccius merluccius]
MMHHAFICSEQQSGAMMMMRAWLITAAAAPAAMALKSCLRRTQSLKSVASPCDDKPARADAAAPREQKASVSRLVARYQNTVEISATIEVTQANNSQAKLKQVQQETTTKTATASAKVVKTAEVSSQRESKAEETNERERSLPHTKTNLTRSRSMGSLQNRPSSIGALKDLFESKNDTPRAKIAGATPVMAEDFQKTKDDLVPPHSDGLGPRGGGGEICGGQVQTSTMPLQPSKVMLHQQRQKCELRRLLKHTHPELKTLDGVMDEELAEVLRLETAGENGYEGEVIARRRMFENHESNHTPNKPTEERPAERGEVMRTSILFDQPRVKLQEDGTKVTMEVAEGPRGPDLNSEAFDKRHLMLRLYIVQH